MCATYDHTPGVWYYIPPSSSVRVLAHTTVPQERSPSTPRGLSSGLGRVFSRTARPLAMSSPDDTLKRGGSATADSASPSKAPQVAVPAEEAARASLPVGRVSPSLSQTEGSAVEKITAPRTHAGVSGMDRARVSDRGCCDAFRFARPGRCGGRAAPC